MRQRQLRCRWNARGDLGEERASENVTRMMGGEEGTAEVLVCLRGVNEN
jgi:hypothetical protein